MGLCLNGFDQTTSLCGLQKAQLGAALTRFKIEIFLYHKAR